jgi:glycine cleavage system aminomethyltransferase T
MPADSAVEVWDTLMREGRPFDIKPAGMLALDVARGLLLMTWISTAAGRR